MMRRTGGPAETYPDDGASPDWATLINRLVDSIGRIARAEMLLLETRFRLTVEKAADRAISRVLAIMVLAITGLLSAACLLCAYIALIHKWLPWWQAFGIGGLTVLVAGFIAFALLNSGARQSK
jgi:hypothetical protein